MSRERPDSASVRFSLSLTPFCSGVCAHVKFCFTSHSSEISWNSETTLVFSAAVYLPPESLFRRSAFYPSNFTHLGNFKYWSLASDLRFMKPAHVQRVASQVDVAMYLFPQVSLVSLPLRSVHTR